MNLTVLAVIIVAWLLARKYLALSFQGRTFLDVATVSTVFYGVLGPWYWLNYRAGWFLHSNWIAEIKRLPIIFLWVYLAIAALSVLFFGRLCRDTDYLGRSARSTKTKKQTSVLLALITVVGFLGAGVVAMRGGAAAEAGALHEDPFLLILLALSDLPIAAFTYVIGSKRLSRGWLVLIAIYTVYAVIVGLRYRLLLLYFPILVSAYHYPWSRPKLARAGMAAAMSVLLSLFSIMTIARDKFSGIDVASLKGAGGNDLLYGLFAETNIIFGLASALKTFGSSYPFVGLDPIWGVFLQFIPRFLYPEKNLYQHLQVVLMGMGGTQEDLNSGTAMPFFGEYYAMFGWWGVAIGVVLYCLAASLLARQIGVLSRTREQLVAGASLVAIFIAYYYFSRGSIAQIVKGVTFVCLPYIALLASEGRTIRIGRTIR